MIEEWNQECGKLKIYDEISLIYERRWKLYHSLYSLNFFGGKISHGKERTPNDVIIPSLGGKIAKCEGVKGKPCKIVED